MPSCDRVDLDGCLAVDAGDYWNPSFEKLVEILDANGDPVLDANGDPVLDANGDPTYEPFDFTGYTVRMRIRETKSGSDVIPALGEVGDVQTTGIYFADKTTGVFQVIIMGATSAGVTPGKYLYEIGVTDSNSNETVLLNGNIIFKEVFS